MPIIKPVFSECGALIAYGNSEGLLQYVASDRYNALRKKIAENNQKDEAQRAMARKEQSERESGPSR